jgi:hypothetical protein
VRREFLKCTGRKPILQATVDRSNSFGRSSRDILAMDVGRKCTLKHKVDDTIKEPESASRIGVVIKWHVLELLILRQEFNFEFH